MSQLGLFLLIVSAALAVAEAHVPTHGVLGGAAVASLAAGIALVIAGAGVARTSPTRPIRPWGPLRTRVRRAASALLTTIHR